VARRVIILGLDGGHWPIVRMAMDCGAMPFLSGLLETGGHGKLRSTIPPKTPAAWGSFQTGKTPGKTGVYDFERWDRATRSSEIVSASMLGPTLWDYVGRAGKRLVVMNVPMTYPARPIAGAMITGLLTPGLRSAFIHPPDLREPLLEHVPDYHIFNLRNATRVGSARRMRRLVERLRAIVDSRARAAQFLLGRERADVAMVHFQATDVLQHALWPMLCPEHPGHDPAVRDYLLSAFYGFLDERLRTVYEAFLGRSLGEADASAGGDDVLCLVVSDHGFQTHRKRIRFGNWLADRGYLAVGVDRGPIPWLRRRLRRLDGPLCRCVFEKTSMGRTLDRFRRRSTVAVDFERSRVYSFGRGCDGYVFFLEDDPQARSATEQRLREDLAELVDPETGRAVVERIHRREDLYTGPRVADLPDWILEPAAGYSFTGNYEPGRRGWFVPVRLGRDFHAGMHHPDGILVASGPGLKPGRINGARLWDVAPTVLAWLGLPVPDDMDGAVLEQMFTEPMEVRYCTAASGESSPEPSATSPADAASPYSSQDADQVEQRRRDLGYIE